ncbi:dihydrodipicolinate synthase family protein [Mucilaginibacter sp. KACC 22773]|uniref:dihydrodipicolinate synthase family protein n=1 Tax=Mucilaginibacter sp. KACC 22773 TaxID=3025671 RepID=UPI002365B7B9|nr:dihydrodipicolinate synthase family protein [Mucilaginibacter sp. KACC 22773]WDF81357.1 dihydrodipicolinate synthase family protein [Mucilaginibacter sp. KACC 22773]
MKQKKKYNGLVVPTITPLTENYKLDHEAVEKIFDNIFNYGGVPFILGTTGEAPSLPDDVKIDFIKLAARLKQPNKLIYAGISSNCLAESIEMAKKCADEGIDVAVAHVPAYFTLTEYEIKKYFETLANSIPLPLIIYNIPATTDVSIQLNLLNDLSYHENIVGTKDSERNYDRLQQSIKLWANRADFSHFLGWGAQSAHALFTGGDGLVPSTGNLFPDIYYKMIVAADNNDEPSALRLQKHSNLVGDLYQGKRLLGESLAALKSLMESAGLCRSVLMPPLQKVSAENAAQLREGLQKIATRENLNLPIYQ